MKPHPSAGPGRRLIVATCAAVLFGAVAAIAAPPAGTPIGNQATATYQDATATSYTVSSNPVTTIVQQVASLTLVANGIQNAAPGAQATFPHVLTNTGNGTDDFALSVSNQAGDDFDLTGLAIYADADGNGVADNFVPVTSTGPLAAGGIFRFVVMGSVPGTQIANDFANLQVDAASGFDPLQTAQNLDQVNVTGNAVINVTKAISAPSGASPSGPYTYTLTYTNAGNATAGNVRLTDLVPAGMTYVPGSGRWSGTGAVALTDADSTDGQGAFPNFIRYDFNEATPGAVTAIVLSVPPGQSGTVSFDVTVNAGLPPQVIDNAARWTYFDGVTDMGPFFTNVASFTVNQTAAVAFTGETVPSALQGATVVFSNVLTNNGNGTDVFEIAIGASTFPAGSTYQLFQADGFTPLANSNGNGTPDTGPLAAGASTTIVLHVTLPPTATGGPYSVDKTATSVADPLASATATDVLTTIVANTVDLTNGSALPGGAGAGPGPEAAPVTTNAAFAGTTSRFTLYVNNTSTQADNYDLAASTDPTFGALTLPAGWTVTFRDAGNTVITNTGPIAAGGATLVYADVDVPAGATPANVSVYFRALSPFSGASDRKHDQVTVNAARALTLVPNNTAQVIPGGFVVYTHDLTNNGNVLEGDGVGSSVALATAESQAGWSSALYWDANSSGVYDAGDQPIADLAGLGGLAPGASVRLFVQVFAPAGATIGQVNTTTVTATTANVGYTSAVPAVGSATDQTTVINAQLQIVKRQALDGDCNGVEDAAFTTLNLTTGAVPNACIRYEIEVTNTGATPVSNVVVNDATPANTVSSNAASASTTVGSISVPADGTAGPVVGTVGNLAPGQTAVLRFNVRINFP